MARAPPTERVTPFPLFIVDSLDVAEQELQELGGQLVDARFELPIAPQGLAKYRETMLKLGLHEGQITDKVGVARKVLDPNGNMLGLLQPDAHSQYAFKTGPFR